MLFLSICQLYAAGSHDCLAQFITSILCENHASVAFNSVRIDSPGTVIEVAGRPSNTACDGEQEYSCNQQYSDFDDTFKNDQFGARK